MSHHGKIQWIRARLEYNREKSRITWTAQILKLHEEIWHFFLLLKTLWFKIQVYLMCIFSIISYNKYFSISLRTPEPIQPITSVSYLCVNHITSLSKKLPTQQPASLHNCSDLLSKRAWQQIHIIMTFTWVLYSIYYDLQCIK